MDVATMVAITNLNMVTVMAVQAANNVITIVNGERTEEDMDGSMPAQLLPDSLPVFRSLTQHIQQVDKP